MTVDEELAGPDAALAGYVAAMRRRRRWYTVAIAALLVAGVAVALVVWYSGEITHVHMRTAASPAPSIPLGTPGPQPARTWQSTDATAIGRPVAGGTVVTYSRHTVTGRDALTGKALWSYSRSDRDVCQVVQQQGKTIAIYENGANCDEVTTLETATGRRVWTRTLDENGLPVNGHPHVTPGDNAIFVATPTALYAIQVSSGGCDSGSGAGCGGDVWTYAPGTGCAIRAAVPGSSGVLISERCADGDHLLLRDPSAGTDSKDPKPVKWRLNGTSAVPVAADAFVGAFDPGTHQLVTYDPAKGKVLARTSLRPAPTTTARVLRAAAGQSELVWVAGTLYALDQSGHERWVTALDALPSVTAPDNSDTTPELASARLLAPTSSGVVELDGSTGKITATYHVAPPAPGRQVFPFGHGFLVAGSTTEVYQ